MSKSAWEPTYVWGGYRAVVRLWGYEVTARPAGLLGLGGWEVLVVEVQCGEEE